MSDLFTENKVKLDIEERTIPMVTSFAPMAPLDLSLVYLAEKPITITTRLETKTQIATSIQIGEAMKGISWEIPGYKFADNTRQDMWDNSVVNVSYFKNLKSQGLPEYKRYMEELVHRVLQKDPYYHQFEGTIKVYWIDRVNVKWQKL